MGGWWGVYDASLKITLSLSTEASGAMSEPFHIFTKSLYSINQYPCKHIQIFHLDDMSVFNAWHTHLVNKIAFCMVKAR